MSEHEIMNIVIGALVGSGMTMIAWAIEKYRRFHSVRYMGIAKCETHGYFAVLAQIVDVRGGGKRQVRKGLNGIAGNHGGCEESE